MKKYTRYAIHPLRMCGLLFCGLLLATALHCVPVRAALQLSDICQLFESAIREGDGQVAFQAPADYSMEQLLAQISKAAKKQQMLFTGEYSYQKQVEGGQASYTFVLGPDAFVKVRRLKRKEDACKAALKALQDCDYKTKFYSETSFYPVFMLMLQQHPEYNYNTMVWKNSNGTYGYRRSAELTKSDQKRRMQAADQKAASFVKKYLAQGMTQAQKLRAIHDYLIGRCQYDYALEKVNGYEDSLTAYGALSKGRAVCQGYTAAFNLLARKAGIFSIAVCGAVPTGDHAWNYVSVDGKYRYVDVTWNKTLQTGPQIRYDYFLITKKLIAQNHTWNSKKYTRKHVSYCKYVKP